MTTAVPTMGSESGFAAEEQPAPIRASGFFAAFFGLMSAFCLLGRPLLFLPVLALVFGLIALRPYDGPKPVGTFPARMGMFLGVLFGSIGFFYPMFSQQTVGKEASHYSEMFLRLVARNDYELAMELMKTPGNRLPEEMSLKKHYAPLRAAADPSAEHPNAVANYDTSEGIEEIQGLDPKVEFFQSRTPRLYSRYKERLVDTFWNNTEKPFTNDLIVTLSYEENRDDGAREWFIRELRFDKERPVAVANY